ncbi:MAG TPA: DUF1906 domain-containing protein [Nocardioidaceae bacterium]|nr:DUF1906 domain-containing protein [Nocardioidaceae bacterium]
MFLLSLVLVSIFAGPTAHAATYISQHRGFDACSAPSKSQMSTWWTNSTFWNVFVYLGGSNRSCGQPNLTPSWVDTVNSQGWQIVFIWVGRQMPYGNCQTKQPYNDYISLNTSTAHTQGVNAAQDAVAALSALNVSIYGTPIVYDLEGYNGGSGCRAAAKSFAKGWADYLQQYPAQKSGVYGSDCSSYVDDFAHDGNPPNFIWPAAWGKPKTTEHIQCISDGHWTHHQRHKQYRGGHSETHGGVTISIDSDCSDGPVFGTRGNDYGGPCV